MEKPCLHIAMYPWFALGHLTPFLHVSNKLAKLGHRISFFIPTKTQPKLQSFNGFPDLISFVPITVPHVDGLPPGAETTLDVPFPLHPLIMTAMDRTEPDIERHLRDLKPDIVFFDFTYWIPKLTRSLGIKSLHYCIISPVTIGYTLSPSRQFSGEKVSEADLMVPPPGYPDSSIKLRLHEARAFAAKRDSTFGSGLGFYERQYISLRDADALGYRTCREIEGQYIDYLEREFKKPVLLSGPAIPEPPTSALEERWAEWLGGFKTGSVVYCAFGSECTLKKEQFQELVLGFELSGLPFLAALKPPFGCQSIEEGLPDGFEERVKERGVVHGGWVQQQLILEHPSVGCFITHCGSGSLSEALVNKCQLVLLPHVGDQIFNARMMANNLKVGVEVEKGEEDGLFTRDGVCKALKSVMDENSEVGKEVLDNHEKIRQLLLQKDLEPSYIDNFTKMLQSLKG
ncbi:cyanidin 3-O-galactoside 2''-O-xylosyltransferase FGGT1 [Ziziphus jujuba]|uniref:Glycosyltransferase n=2 Tax=Ziziphus jujuba TaxID=326968 RepID=A0A6P3ZHA9_ZIZJJ|nr:cyanidin 3-O-galactoside 2''-O-xylosyltransferase FGGT1 [Ziziphus jujuba]KAH7533158.1 hypothetical protein FEM48_Zijuj04G0100600 [Ziziphus jujuba var. spinosa]